MELQAYIQISKNFTFNETTSFLYTFVLGFVRAKMIVHALMIELDQLVYYYTRKIEDYEHLCTKTRESGPRHFYFFLYKSESISQTRGEGGVWSLNPLTPTAYAPDKTDDTLLGVISFKSITFNSMLWCLCVIFWRFTIYISWLVRYVNLISVCDIIISGVARIFQQGGKERERSVFV